MMFINYIGSSIVFGVILLLKKQSFFVPREKRTILATRCVGGVINLGLGSSVFAYLSLVLATTLINTTPFWASLIGWLFLKETLSKFEIFALVVSFMLIFIVTK